MSTAARPFTPPPDPAHVRFLALLPRIETHARVYFRGVGCSEKQADRVAETVALAWKWFLRLQQRGKDPERFPATFASLAARAVKSGRRAAGMERAKDVMSERCQRRHGFRVESLPASPRAPREELYAQPRGQWLQDAFEERLRDNTISPVPEQVQFRLDFPAWLATLTGRERRIIRAMAPDERTTDLSREFEVSPGRISQLRREFQTGWKRFCGDLTDPAERQPGGGA